MPKAQHSAVLEDCLIFLTLLIALAERDAVLGISRLVSHLYRCLDIPCGRRAVSKYRKADPSTIGWVVAAAAYD